MDEKVKRRAFKNVFIGGIFFGSFVNTVIQAENREEGSDSIDSSCLERGTTFDFCEISDESEDENNMALFEAVKNGDEVTFQYIIEQGKNVNVSDLYGSTPLHFLPHIKANKKRLKFAKLLLDNGANVNAKDSNDDTPLHFLIGRSDITIIRLLKEKGADLNAKNKDGNTPLHEASKGKYLNAIQYLISNGAEINVKNNQGNTPLHIAVIFGKYKIMNLLLKTGADINATNRKGKTPLDCARFEKVQSKSEDKKKEYQEIENRLIEVGAKMVKY